MQHEGFAAVRFSVPLVYIISGYHILYVVVYVWPIEVFSGLVLALPCSHVTCVYFA